MTTTHQPLLVAAAAALAMMVFAAADGAAQIPTLEEPVTTAFGTYQPAAIVVEPDALWYEVEPGLANVLNASSFDLPPEVVSRLEEQSFCVVTGREELYADAYPTPYDAYVNFEDVYIAASEAGIPLFVTTDSLLHAFHRLFDHALKTTEEEFLAGETVDLAGELLAGLTAVHDGASNEEVRTAARLAAGHLAVGLSLLDPEAERPAWLEPELSTELQYIEDAGGRYRAPLFDAYWEDYTQYIPRGHYTRSEILERYFRGMMWYGRMTFALREMSEAGQPIGEPGENRGQRPDLTAAALLLVRQLLLEGDDGAAVERWHGIYDPTEFFVGESDDLQYDEYAGLAASVYGETLDQLTPEQVCDAERLQVFMDRAETELPRPRIRGLAPQGLRLFGQRFLPDSWYLSELVYDAVGGTSPSDPPRLMPSVLDVMSVLGSTEAEELQRLDGAEEYGNYIEQLAMLRADVASGSPERWAATLYWSWLYTMAPLLETWGEGFPPYMQSAAWPRRQLMCAAGTWTELRHDTILYVKQSSTSPWTQPDPTSPFTQGAVEPNPWLFARLGALAAYARAGLGDLGLLEEQVGDKLEDMEIAAQLLADAAARELERRPLTGDQYLFILHFGDWLSALLNLDDGDGVADDDDRSPVVADVHTDPNTASVLEEGTGYAGRILVIADVEGRLVLTVGAAFIPFEFTHPMDDRLTDEAWWEMLAADPPSLPWWTSPVLTEQDVVAVEAPGASRRIFQLQRARVDLEREQVEVGQPIVLSCEPDATRLRVLIDDRIVRTLTVPSGSGSTVGVATNGLPQGDVTVVTELANGAEVAVRARIVEAAPRTRQGGRRVAP